jgi:DNA-binding IclR family transcriptional regulator
LNVGGGLCRYAIDDQETTLNIRCVAVPVRNANGHKVATISVTDHDAERMDENRRPEARDALLGGAVAIGRKVFRATAI